MWKLCYHMRNASRTAVELYYDGMTLKTKQNKQTKTAVIRMIRSEQLNQIRAKFLSRNI